MDALILAAGDGTRLHPLTKDIPKAMINIYGVPILERALYVLKNVGVKRAVIVIGYKGDIIKNYFGNKWKGIEIIYRTNDSYEDGILKSAIKAKDAIDSRFIFLCGDTIPNSESLRLALEKKGDMVVTIRDLEDDSVVADANEKGKVEKIGMRKDMKKFSASVAGFSINEPVFFEAIEACVKNNIFDRPAAIQWLIDNNYEVNSFPISNDALLEIDTFDDLKYAKKIIFNMAIKARIKKPGLFKKLFNFPISLPLTKLLVKTNLTPNQITLISLLFFIIAGGLFSLKYFIIGGILCYLGAMLDGVDGKIARLKFKSSYLGKCYDSICDRLSELSIVIGLTYGIYFSTNNYQIFLLGLLTTFFLVGRFYIQGVYYALMNEQIHISKIWRGSISSKLLELANRDLTFFVVLVSCLFGYPIIGFGYMTLSATLAFSIRSFQTMKTMKMKQDV